MNLYFVRAVLRGVMLIAFWRMWWMQLGSSVAWTIVNSLPSAAEQMLENDVEGRRITVAEFRCPTKENLQTNPVGCILCNHYVGDACDCLACWPSW